MPQAIATVGLQHPTRGAVTITVASDDPALAAHVANSIKAHFDAPKPIKPQLPSAEEVLRAFNAPPNRSPFFR